MAKKQSRKRAAPVKPHPFSVIARCVTEPDFSGGGFAEFRARVSILIHNTSIPTVPSVITVDGATYTLITTSPVTYSRIPEPVKAERI